ncbi:MAG: Xaa-Pro peptidase family protein [Candidatus Nanopelagicales bacterium]|jgi:Xaa-Pro dipeptidase|nr:Xaa-Pro peptidase family protein [Candidatus Nanopelagicales bacterium]NKB92036.1 M24 family metallopeptidase [Candidatus Nanopelagicales bacterium]
MTIAPASEFAQTSIAAPGIIGVDWEERVDYARLRDYRLARARQALEASDLGALLVFESSNIRYVTATHIGTWGHNKTERWALLTRTGEPWIWDFGSAAKNHRLYSPWLKPEQSNGGNNGLQGAIAPTSGLPQGTAQQIASILKEEGVAGMPIGVDVIEMPMLRELEAAGITVNDGQQVMLNARQIKNKDEILLLSQAASMVDGVYQDISEALKPGVRENDIVALATRRLLEMGSEQVEAINSIAGERCSPHPHVFSDRLIRPGDQAYFDIIHAFNGYRTCYYRTFAVGRATNAHRDAYKKARELIDSAIAMVKPGVTTDQIAALWPTAQEFGFSSEMEAFGLQFGHGLGLGLHERPVISRLNSLENPVEIEPGMVFALETYWPASDGHSAARIEEELVVTDTGAELLTLFPAEELFVTNPY